MTHFSLQWLMSLLLMLLMARSGWTADCSMYATGCNSSFTATVLTRLGIKKPTACMCNGEIPTNENWQYLDDKACTTDVGCVLEGTAPFNAASASYSRPCVQGASLPGTCTVGNCFQDTVLKAMYLCTDTNLWTRATGGAVCRTLESVVDTDDNFGFWIAPPEGATLVAVTCHCEANCATPPELAFEKRSASGISAISLTGGGNLTCASGDTTTNTYTTFLTTDTDRILTSGQGVRFDVTNTPTTNAMMTFCVTYR